jgi:hypothetical protein
MYRGRVRNVARDVDSMLRVMLGDICPLENPWDNLITLYGTCVALSSDDWCGVRTVLNGDLRETER